MGDREAAGVNVGDAKEQGGGEHVDVDERGFDKGSWQREVSQVVTPCCTILKVKIDLPLL